MVNFYEQINHNKTRTWVVMVVFVVFIAVTAWLIGEWAGYGVGLVPVALVFSSLSAAGIYFFSDKLVLGLSGASLAKKEDYFDYYTVVENLSLAGGTPMPKVYVIESSAMNAFATGRSPQHAVICVTTGLLEKLDRTELEGVVAHEMSHIKDYDILLMSVVAVLVGTVATLANLAGRSVFLGGGRRKSGRRDGGVLAILGLLALILSPLIANLIKLALSRQREFLADAQAAKLTRFPEGLADALAKISSDRNILETAHSGTAHLFITNPFANTGSRLASLFSTHPPVEERVRRLREM
ncbi:MAG: M48 family metallopeptidase [bacterium]